MKIKFILTYTEVYHRCFRLLVRIVRMSVYYGSMVSFLFIKIVNLREKVYNFVVVDCRSERKYYGIVGYGFYMYGILLYNSWIITSWQQCGGKREECWISKQDSRLIACFAIPWFCDSTVKSCVSLEFLMCV